MRYKQNWEETKQRYDAWWERSSIGRPMLNIVVTREPTEVEPPPECAETLYLDVQRIVRERRVFFERSSYDYAEAFPAMDLNLGPGSLACYLGSEPCFSPDTVWYKPCVEPDWESWPDLRFDPEARWWRTHRAMFKLARELAADDFAVNIPDLIENVDILAAMRGPQELCLDLMDDPSEISRRVAQLDELYFSYYDEFYRLCGLDLGSSYTAFSIWGSGRTAKVQCDFSAMLSPGQFREFVLESLRRQCRTLDHSLYHLDGPDALRHLDAVLEIDELDALQWVPGAGLPDMCDECWYPVYEKVRRADKSLWIQVEGRDVDEWIAKAEPLVKRFGRDGLYLLFPLMDEASAQALLRRAEIDW